MTAVALGCLALFAAGAASIALAYYGGPPSPIWKARFRVVNGVDHVGPILETVFLFLSTATLAILGTAIYPDVARDLMDPSGRLWLTAAVAVLAAALATHRGLRSGPRELEARIPTDPRLASIRAMDTQERAVAVDGIRRAYRRYIPFSTALIFTITMAFTVAGFGIGEGIQELDPPDTPAEPAELAIHAGDGLVCHGSGPHAGVPPTTAAGAAAVSFEQAAARALARFAAYEARFAEFGERYLAVLGLLLLMALWFFATPFLQVYATSMVTAMRVLAGSLILLVAVGVLLAAAHLIRTTEAIEAPFRAVLACIATADGVDHAALIADWRALRSELSLQAFWSRLATSWGALLLVFQFVLSAIQRRRTGRGLLAGIIGSSPLLGAVLGRLSPEPEEED